MSKLVGQSSLPVFAGTHGEGRNENAKDKTTAGLQRSEKLRLFDMQRTRVLAIKRSFLLSQAQVSSTHTPPWFASTDPVRCSSSTVE